MATDKQLVCMVMCIAELLSAAEDSRIIPVGTEWEIIAAAMHDAGLFKLHIGESYSITDKGREWLGEYRHAKAQAQHTA